MFGAVDATLRPLKIPSKFVPYMEKHRIYELFHELATGLVIQQPSDHILYLKQSLRLAARKRDLPRLILLGEPYANMCILAETLQKKIALRPITLADIRNAAPEIAEEAIGEREIVTNLIVILKKMATDFTGWILVDLPRTKKEARAIQRAGIIPTHVLEIVNSPQNRCEKRPSSERENNLRDLRELYDDLLIKIETGDRSVEALAEACATMAKRKKHCGAPSIFRVVLIGPRGSLCYDSAKYLARRFNLVHVDFDGILQQARLQENSLGKTLRMIEYRWGKRPEADTRIRVVEPFPVSERPPRGLQTATRFLVLDCRPFARGHREVGENVCRYGQLCLIKFQLLKNGHPSKYWLSPTLRWEKYLLGRECSRRGWILTGYPITLEDFELLDTSLPASPNRVIFVRVSKETLLVRLLDDRRIVASCSATNPDSIASRNCLEENEFVPRPPERDRKMIERDLEEYEKNVNSLLTYAGESATVVEGNVDERILIERIEACLMRPAPCAPARRPRVDEKIEIIEFEPDDPPDHRIVDELRQTESILSFM